MLVDYDTIYAKFDGEEKSSEVTVVGGKMLTKRRQVLVFFLIVYLSYNTL